VDKPIADLKGVVVKAFPTKQNENGRWKPANFDIKTESGVVKVKRFPDGVWDKEKGVKITPVPIVMPAWYDKLIATYGDTLYSLVGSTVQVKGEGAINGTTMAIEYTVLGENFFVVDDESTQAPSEEQGKPLFGAVYKTNSPPDVVEEVDLVPTPPSIDPNQMRIMRQSTLGYSATLLAGKEFASPQLMVERTIQVATKLLEYVISGEMPFFDEEAEVEEDIV